MSKEGFTNIETLVLLTWFIEDFDSKFTRYRFTGDSDIISRIIDSASSGRITLFRMKSHVEEISKTLGLDLTSETVPSQPVPQGPWVNVSFLSFGVEAGEFVNTYAIQFISKVVSNDMGIKVPTLKFKIFYLPPLPVATTEIGHVTTSLSGFTNIGKRRIEINIRPPHDYENIFKSIVHEILHVCILDESNINDPQTVEFKVDELSRIFFTKSQKEYDSNRNMILKSIQDLIIAKISTFHKANALLSNIAKYMGQATLIINDFFFFFDAILDGRIKLTLI